MEPNERKTGLSCILVMDIVKSFGGPNVRAEGGGAISVFYTGEGVTVITFVCIENFVTVPQPDVWAVVDEIKVKLVTQFMEPMSRGAERPQRGSYRS